MGNVAQVPTQLRTLTGLHMLDLRQNKARLTKSLKVKGDTDGAILVPKMAVTERRLKWLLKCPNIQQVSAYVAFHWT